MAKTVDTLPLWGEMSEQDRAVAVLHVWHRWWDGQTMAIRDFPARYVAHPTLTALADTDPTAACQHAAEVTGGTWSAACKRFGPDEAIRLRNLARQLATV